MFGKLMKYEYRSSLRKVSVIWVSLFGASIIFGGLARILEGVVGSPVLLLTILSTLSGFVFAALIAAVVVATAMIIIRRFRQGLLGDEGYLMHTLPVSTRQLIISKGLVAATILLLSLLVIFISSLVVARLLGNDSFFYTDFDLGSGYTLLLTVEMILLAVAKILSEIYKIYAAISIAQLRDNHRTLTAVGAYLGIDVAMGLLTTILGLSGVKMGTLGYLVFFEKASDIAQSQMALGGLMVCVLFELIVYHVITERILCKKLNLL